MVSNTSTEQEARIASQNWPDTAISGSAEILRGASLLPTERRIGMALGLQDLVSQRYKLAEEDFGGLQHVSELAKEATGRGATLFSLRSRVRQAPLSDGLLMGTMAYVDARSLLTARRVDLGPGSQPLKDVDLLDDRTAALARYTADFYASSAESVDGSDALAGYAILLAADRAVGDGKILTAYTGARRVKSDALVLFKDRMTSNSELVLLPEIHAAVGGTLSLCDVADSPRPLDPSPGIG